MKRFNFFRVGDSVEWSEGQAIDGKGSWISADSHNLGLLAEQLSNREANLKLRLKDVKKALRITKKLQER